LLSIYPGFNQDCPRSSGRSQASLPAIERTVAESVADFASIYRSPPKFRPRTTFGSRGLNRAVQAICLAASGNGLTANSADFVRTIQEE
jgi:hypothetical protein